MINIKLTKTSEIFYLFFTGLVLDDNNDKDLNERKENKNKKSLI